MFWRSSKNLGPTILDLEANHPAMKSPYTKPEQSSKKLLTYGGIAVTILFCLYVYQSLRASGGGLSHLRTDTFPDSFRLAVIADLDQSSKKEGKQSWHSLYMTVSCKKNPDP